MPNYEYAVLENLLRQALELAQEQLAPVETRNILDFLDAAEYGLAFETLACSMMEANAPVATAFRALTQDATHRIDYGDDFSGIHNGEVAAALTLVWEACCDCAE